jgi:hypothetical protein
MKRLLASAARKRNGADGADHADSHGSRDRQTCREHIARHRVAQDKSRKRTRDHARHESKRLAVRGSGLMALA